MGSVCSEARGEGLNSATLWEDCWVGQGWRAWPVEAELGWGVRSRGDVSGGGRQSTLRGRALGVAGDQHLLPGLSTECSTVGWLPAQARPLPSSPPTLPIEPASVPEIPGLSRFRFTQKAPVKLQF